jgi:hypothetical protein
LRLLLVKHLYNWSFPETVQATEEVLQQTERVAEALRRRGEKLAHQLRDQARRFLPLVRRVNAQTRSRVLEGQKAAPPA